jgi:hypothetical protein
MMAGGCSPDTSGPILRGGANLLGFFTAMPGIARSCMGFKVLKAAELAVSLAELPARNLSVG